MDKRTALVTGGNRGLGYEICRQLRDEGLDVILTGRDRTKISDAAHELGVSAMVLDLLVPDGPSAAAAQLAASGVQVDVVINNAVLYDFSEALEIDPASLERVVRTNLLGPWAVLRAFVPAMIEPGRVRDRSARPVADGADTIVWLATHPAGGPNGGFFRNRSPIEW